MDVTPEEARSIEFRGALRGYQRNEVDDFLDRIAATLDQLLERMAALDAEVARARANDETIQRTLLVAQRTADELGAHAEAQARAQINEAENTARQIIEAERQRYAAEMRELASRRDVLAGDVQAIEQFESDYRVRLTGMIQTDLEALSRRASVAGAHPPMHEVAVPPEPELPAPTSTEALNVEAIESDIDPEFFEERQGLPESSPQMGIEDPRDLADEEFLLSLREVGVEDEPSGSRGDAPGAGTMFFDQDVADTSGRLGAFFRRSR